MVRLRIIMRGSEQCVRLIWSVIVLRVGAIQISDFAPQCLVSKAAKFIAREPWLGAGPSRGGTLGSIIILRVLTPGPHACSESCVELYPRLVFFYSSFILAQKPPTSAPLAAARSEQLRLRRRLGEPAMQVAMQREIGSAIPDFAGDCVSGAVYRKYPFDRSNSGRSRRLRHGDEGRRAPSADVLRRVE